MFDTSLKRFRIYNCIRRLRLQRTRPLSCHTCCDVRPSGLFSAVASKNTTINLSLHARQLQVLRAYVFHTGQINYGIIYMYNTYIIDANIDDYLRFYVPLKNFSLIWRRHHWRAAKFRPMPGAQGLWAGRDLYHATPSVTRDLGFSGLSEGPPHSVAWDVEDQF
jgi:hypothetical protein